MLSLFGYCCLPFAAGSMGAYGSKIRGGAARFSTHMGVSPLLKGLKYDPDDKWSNLHREREKNHMYRWIQPDATGEIIDAFDREGEEGVLKFAGEKMASLMYQEGQGTETITMQDFIKWRKNMCQNLGQEYEVEKTFLEHEAQWQLKKRGVEGETLLHLLLTQDQPKCAEICKILILNYPGLIQDIYEGQEKYGQNLLHLAIVQNNYDMATFLIENGINCSQRATGQFFLPEDQKISPPKKNTDYIGYAYYGEYPLALAACFANKDIYDALIEAGADPNLPDNFGNTVAHLCVIHNCIEMYSYAVRHWAKPLNVNATNGAGDTPLTLASTMGRKDIFEKMLELSKVEFWRFSDMACSAYPLTALDSIMADGATDWDSALIKIINGSTTDHLDIIDSEVVQRLLADKWKAFAARKLFERLATLIVHLTFMCVAVYTRPPELQQNILDNLEAIDIVRYISEFCTCVGCILFVLQQQGSDLRRQGFGAYKRNLKNAPTKGIFLVANILILMCIPCRFLGAQDLEESLLCFALPGSWVFLLFFARGWLVTGPFVQMIYNMIAGDMVRFSTISAIFLVSFSQVFYFVGKDMQSLQEMGICEITGYKISTYENFLETFLALFRMSMGGYDYEELQCAQYETLTKIIFVLYMIVMPIMLINMLIAMMGNTYTAVITQAEKAWRQQWGQIVMDLEQSINKQKLAKFQLEYSIQLAEARRGGQEIRGLMVIKQTKKTRAAQRRQAIAGWKRVGRKAMQMVRQHGRDKAKELLHSNDIALLAAISSQDLTTEEGIHNAEMTLAASVRRASVMPTMDIRTGHTPLPDMPQFQLTVHQEPIYSNTHQLSPINDKVLQSDESPNSSSRDVSPELPGSFPRKRRTSRTSPKPKLSAGSPLAKWKPPENSGKSDSRPVTGVVQKRVPNIPDSSVRIKVVRDVSLDMGDDKPDRL